MAADTRTITKKDLVEKAAARAGVNRTATRDALQALLDTIIDELGQGHRIELREFGVFEVKARAARTAQNPKTLERVRVPPRGAVRFKAGRRMKEAIENLPAILAQTGEDGSLKVHVVKRESGARVEKEGR